MLELERRRRRTCRPAGRRRRRGPTAARWRCSPARRARRRAWRSGGRRPSRGSSGSATPSQVVSSFDQRVTQWMSVWTVLRGSSLNCCPGQGERRVDLAPDLEVPGREVRVRDRAVVEDRELVGLVLAGRDALGDGGVLSLRRRRVVRTSWAMSSRCGLLRIVSHCRDGPVTGASAAAAVPFARAHRRSPRPRRHARASCIVMPAYNAARTLERTYADIPHDLVHRIILVDDVSRDETVDDRPPARARRDHPQPEPGLRRQPEDVLRRRPGRRRRHRGHAPPGLPVRRDADPRARSPRSSTARAT